MPPTLNVVIIPSPNLILSDVRRTETTSFAYDGSADVCVGQWTLQSGKILPVTLKLVRRCLLNDKTAADHVGRRFLREAHLWIQLHHPNIVPFYGLIFEENLPGLVMGYYENGDLVQFLQSHPDANKIDMISQVAAGLEYLHTLKPNPIIHGDIKASNIMVTDNNQACLTGFGVARMINVSIYTTTSLGNSYRWMSPEMMGDDGLSPTLTSDIWGLGMTILQIYTGKVPFPHLRNTATVILSISRGDLPQQPLGIDDALWALLKQCWQPEPTNRPTASTLSIVLDIMASQNLTADRVKALVGFLEQMGDNSQEAQTLSATPATSTTDTLVPSAGPDESPPSNLCQGHSLSRYIRRAGAALGKLPRALLRQFADEKQEEVPPPTVIKDSYIYRCFWPSPQCDVGFPSHSCRMTHRIQHWTSWEPDDLNDSVPRSEMDSHLG